MAHELAIPYLFRPNTERYEGVRPVQIHLLRTLYLLMFLFVGYDSWSGLIGHQGPWSPMSSAALCMFASYSLLSIVGLFKPLKMLPIVLFVVLYKSIWMAFVAYPLWANGQLEGSPVEGMAKIFMWVLPAFLIVPWKYVLDRYVRTDRARG